MKRHLAAIVVACLGILQALADTPTEIHARVREACVYISAGREGRGAGWVVDVRRRWVVTCFHVVGDAKNVDVVLHHSDARAEVVGRLGEWRVPGRVVKRDAMRDLALLELERLPPSIRALPLAVTPARPGERVQLVGHRGDLDQMWAHANGVVRQSFRAADGYPWRTQRLAKGARLLALQMSVSEGDSGGPVVNERGEVVAVTAAVLFPAQRSAAAIELAEIRAFLGDEFQIKEPAPAERDRYAELVRASALVQSPSSAGRATAFVVDRDRRLLLTTALAAGPHERVELVFPRFDGQRLLVEESHYKEASRVRAAVLARDSRRNLALLEAETLPPGTTALGFADESPKPGDELTSVGNPNGIDALWLHSTLTVRQLGKVRLATSKEAGLVSTIILQGPGGGDGGGALVDASGRVVGVAGAKDGPDPQVTYAVALAEVRALLDESRPLWRPEYFDEFHRRGASRLRQRRLDAALADFTEALRLDPKHRATLTDVPTLHRRRGHLKEALVAIERALKDIPLSQSAPLFALRAGVRSDLGQFDEALSDAEIAVKLDGKSAAAFAARATAWLGKKEFAKALVDADEAVWLDANHGAAYLVRGRIRLERREFDDAVTDLTRALEMDPFDIEPLILRAVAFEEKTPPEPAKARRDREAAEKLRR